MNFDKESKSDFFFGFCCWGVLGGAETIIVCQKQNVKCGKKKNKKHLHTVEHVVKSRFQNMLITF